jgi:hypothetical protein
MRIKSFPRFTKLFIQWTDIVSDSAWHDKDEIDKAHSVLVNTVGFFLQNKKGELKVAHSITDDCDSDYTVIPWCVIKHIEELETKHETESTGTSNEKSD